MAVFAIIPQPNVRFEALDQAIHDAFPGDVFALDGQSGWLIAAPSDAQALADQLKITAPSENGAALVLEIKGYWGHANPNTWTWLQQHSPMFR